MNTVRSCALVFLLALLLAACTGGSADPSSPGGAPPADLAISSPAFAQGAPIPVKYTCAGEDISPPLEWSGIPAGVKSLALVVDDPDAPGGTWVHWVVVNLPPDTPGLPEGASRAKGEPAAPLTVQMQGKNSWGRADYGGPCPPSGQHRYYFKLYALDTVLDGQSPDQKALLQAMEGHVLARGEWMGVFQK